MQTEKESYASILLLHTLLYFPKKLISFMPKQWRIKRKKKNDKKN